MVRSKWFLTVLVVLASATVGCGSSDRPADGGAVTTAQRFAQAVGNDDHSRACSLLAPTTRKQLEQAAGAPCPTALAEEELAVAGGYADIAVFGTMAQVRFSEDTVFVTKFARGWKVLAAGCAPVPGAPYDCRLQGG